MILGLWKEGYAMSKEREIYGAHRSQISYINQIENAFHVAKAIFQPNITL